MMTARECYRRIALFKKADRIPNYEGGFSPRTIAAWHKEGLPVGVSVDEFFGFDKLEMIRGISYGPIPGVPGRFTSPEQYAPLVAPLGYTMGRDDQGAIVARRQDVECYLGHNEWGDIRLFLKRRPGDEEDYAEGAFEHVRGALETAADWDAIKGHFQPDIAARYPKDWDANLARWKTRDWPQVLEAPGMIGSIVQLMGFENYSTQLYENRPMLEEMLDKMTDLAMAILPKAVHEAQPDMLWFWEDMAFRNGPFVGPRVFDELAVPRYKRLTDWYRKLGGDIVAVDSDGDVRLLIPGWIKGGINHIFPFEVFAGMDVVSIRKQYGQAFSMRGGMDKFVVAKGKDAINRELDRVYPVVQDGGYIPHLDHMLPHAPFENYCYYMERKKQMLGI